MDGQPPAPPRPRHVLVIGGGASGVLMATHLLARRAAGLRVTLVERNALLGCGIAYATTHPDHLLNTRVSQMSAYPDQPDHFARWLGARADPAPEPAAAGGGFVSRAVYGRYMLDLLSPWRAPDDPGPAPAPETGPGDDPGAGPLSCLRGECVALRETPGGIEARLADGCRIRADAAILATGHAVPATPPAPLRGAWDFSPPPGPEAPVAIIGTGLSMIDHVMTLLAGGHTGPITSVSRRGLLPQVHADTRPLPLDRAGIPLGAPVSRVLRWLRGLARQAEARGGTWRDAVDGLRPHVAAVWQAWDAAQRARFLRHAAAVWEVHRHRMPPASAARLQAALARGQLRILRGRFLRAEAAQPGRIALHLALRAPGRAGAAQVLDCAHLIDCRGIRRDPARDATPVVRAMLQAGSARLDPLALGLDTTIGGQVIGRDGTASGRIFAIGPAARGAVWEITAIPDIRQQAAELAAELSRALLGEPAGRG